MGLDPVEFLAGPDCDGLTNEKGTCRSARDVKRETLPKYTVARLYIETMIETRVTTVSEV